MMGVERISKPESDTEPFPGSVGCSWLYFFAFAGGNRVECDWKAKPYSAVKPAVNVRLSGQLLPKGGELNLSCQSRPSPQSPDLLLSSTDTTLLPNENPRICFCHEGVFYCPVTSSLSLLKNPKPNPTQQPPPAPEFQK